MNIRLRRNARTTPATRREMQASTLTTASLARQYGVCEETVAKWRKREDVQDASHCPHRLQTTLTPAQEAVVVELRKLTLLPLDDLLSLVQEFINADASRSGLDRCLRRHGVSRLADLRPKEETPKRRTSAPANTSKTPCNATQRSTITISRNAISATSAPYRLSCTGIRSSQICS